MGCARISLEGAVCCALWAAARAQREVGRPVWRCDPSQRQGRSHQTAYALTSHCQPPQTTKCQAEQQRYRYRIVIKAFNHDGSPTLSELKFLAHTALIEHAIDEIAQGGFLPTVKKLLQGEFV